MLEKNKMLSCGCGGSSRFAHYTIGRVNVDIRIPYYSPPNFILASLTDLPFRSKVFKKAISFNVLEHIPEYLKALTEMVRVSRWVMIKQAVFFDPTNFLEADHHYYTICGLFKKNSGFMVSIIKFVLGFRFIRYVFRILSKSHRDKYIDKQQSIRIYF